MSRRSLIVLFHFENVAIEYQGRELAVGRMNQGCRDQTQGRLFTRRHRSALAFGKAKQEEHAVRTFAETEDRTISPLLPRAPARDTLLEQIPTEIRLNLSSQCLDRSRKQYLVADPLILRPTGKPLAFERSHGMLCIT